MTKERKLYWVNWYRNGYCYKSTTNVPYEGVKEYKKLAKSFLVNSNNFRIFAS